MWWSLLFISYLLIVLYCLQNLVLAVVYNFYRRHFKIDLVKRALLRVRLLDDAFDLLDTKGKQAEREPCRCMPRDRRTVVVLTSFVPFPGERSLSRAAVERLFVALSSARGSGSMRGASARRRFEVLFQMLDTADDGRLSRLEFRRLVELIELKLVEESSSLVLPLPQQTVSLLTRIVRHRHFRRVMDVLVVINAAVVLISFTLHRAGIYEQTTVVVAEVTLTLLFLLEAILKIGVFGKRMSRMSKSDDIPCLTLAQAFERTG